MTKIQADFDDDILDEIREFTATGDPVLLVSAKEDVENFMDPDLVNWV